MPPPEDGYGRCRKPAPGATRHDNRDHRACDNVGGRRDQAGFAGIVRDQEDAGALWRPVAAGGPDVCDQAELTKVFPCRQGNSGDFEGNTHMASARSASDARVSRRTRSSSYLRSGNFSARCRELSPRKQGRVFERSQRDGPHLHCASGCFPKFTRMPGRSSGVPTNSMPARSRAALIAASVEVWLGGMPSKVSMRLMVLSATPE